MGKPDLVWPKWDARFRGARYWLRPDNIAASRRHFRSDHSNEWRYEHGRTASVPHPPPGNPQDPAARSRTISWLLGRDASAGFRAVILGDTGEGDASQYGLLPVIRALQPDFMIINGDVAYPAGTDEDYRAGFFLPYQGLRIPIWAVPGNHDYYSEHRGREFHEIFCTDLRRAQWDQAMLRCMPQPGPFWELTGPSARQRLVILGVDTGHSADLDGTKGAGFFGFGQHQPPDTAQREWLEWRLRKAEGEGAAVLLLYHIPALVREKHVKKTSLKWLHQLIGQFPCIKVVLTAHEHNFQWYTPEVFAKYLKQEHGTDAVGRPEYLVCGAAGATMTSTDFDAGRKSGYLAAIRYPTAEDWKDWAATGLKLLEKVRLEKSFLSRVMLGLSSIGLASNDQIADADRPERLSFMVLDRAHDGHTTLRACFLDDLAQLYQHLPDNHPVEVQSGVPPLPAAALAACFRTAPITLVGGP